MGRALAARRSDEAGLTAETVVAWARESLEGEPDRDLLEAALSACERATSPKSPAALRHDLLLLQGIALSQLGRSKDALARLGEAAALFPDSLEVALERGVALFELCRFEEAEPLFAQVVESDPEEAFGWFYLGLISERRGELAVASRYFTRAERHGKDLVPTRLRLTKRDFDAAVAEAVGRLPERLAPLCAGIPLDVEPVPAIEDLLAVRPPLSPSILGVFRGPPLGVRGEKSIVLYRHNLERSARSREELVDQIGVTLLHEIGHLVGLSEEELWRRGLE
jgi:predicted Zn-dependent protease with MMP-like domain